jgi:hypothetical protein
MLALIIEMNDVIDELCLKIDSILKVSGLEVVDDLTNELMLISLDFATTVYEDIDSNRPLNVMQVTDLRQAWHDQRFHETYQGDYYTALIEMCNEENDELRQLAQIGVDVLVQLMIRTTEVMLAHPGCRNLMREIGTTTDFSTGKDLPLLMPSVTLAPNSTDVIVTIKLNPELTHAAA